MSGLDALENVISELHTWRKEIDQWMDVATNVSLDIVVSPAYHKNLGERAVIDAVLAMLYELQEEL